MESSLYTSIQALIIGTKSSFLRTPWYRIFKLVVIVLINSEAEIFMKSNGNFRTSYLGNNSHVTYDFGNLVGSGSFENVYSGEGQIAGKATITLTAVLSKNGDQPTIFKKKLPT